MKGIEIYDDIARRTGGDIYLGVVGPVRTGKSTFIRKFVQELILNEVKDKHEKQRIIDELPQSGAGKMVMTVQPKFVPNKAVALSFDSGIDAKIRLVDCVGYMIPNAVGAEEDGVERMIKTPWSDEDMPFREAAEIGTKKVIAEHSTIAVMVTSDGSVTDIDRLSYVSAEERVVRELKEAGKPFVIVLNSSNPQSEEAKKLEESLKAKYSAPVVLCDVSKLSTSDIEKIITLVLYEFPVRSIEFDLPKWVRALPYENEFIQEIMAEIRDSVSGISKMSEHLTLGAMFAENQNISSPTVNSISLAEGSIRYEIPVSSSMFYKMLSDECGVEIPDDFYLMSYMKHLTYAKTEYDKIKSALESVKENGYGVVTPTLEEMTLEEPQIIKKNGSSAVRLKATAPALHIMRVDVETEVCPAVGSPEQSEALVKYLMDGFESNPQGIWQTNMFGKPLSSFVQDGIATKISNIPEEAEVKMRKTMTKIVNENRGGIICVLL
ncbi:MAG: stage IV sporulation protein A [Clostridia bacterium]|nr:stage IV sporulation protein A [Clostridia bacterium]